VSFSARTPESAEAARVTGNEAWGSVSRTIAGMLVYGGIGYALGALLGNANAGMALGVIIGVGFGLYLSYVSINALGAVQQPLRISTATSWSARMTRARMERADKVSAT
jgi:F0F1-type ATP synthase assembly protein I